MLETVGCETVSRTVQDLRLDAEVALMLQLHVHPHSGWPEEKGYTITMAPAGGLDEMHALHS